MRKSILVFMAFAMLCLLQISWLNRLSTSTTFNLPLTVLLMALPFLPRSGQVAAALGASLPLDYFSALPFGSYFLSVCGTATVFLMLAQRLPIRTNKLLHLGLIGLTSMIVFMLLFGLTTLASVVRLAPLSFSSDIRELFYALAAFTGLNCLLALALYGGSRLIRLLLAKRLFLSHAAR